MPLRRVPRVVLAVAALFVLVPDLPGVLSARQPAERIVAIADIHGAYKELTTLLRAAGLIDTQETWTGGRAVLVQTGDILDRGAEVRAVLDLLMRLQGEARRAGGRVEVALGNHEVMNILHDFRDVAPEVYAAFADARSEQRRERAFSDYVSLLKRRQPGAPAPDREAWMTAHPPGFVEYTEALAPRARYGRWIRDRKAAVKVGDTLFMHAGIGPETPGSIDDVNRAVKKEIETFDARRATLVQAGLIRPFFTFQEMLSAVVAELQQLSALIQAKQPIPEDVTQEYVDALQGLARMDKSPLITEQGPLWFRGYAQWPEQNASQLEAVLRRLGVARVVCGHTPIPSGITPRFDGRVILLDTGMLTSVYKGRPSALEIQGSELTAIYADGRQPLAAAVAR